MTSRPFPLTLALVIALGAPLGACAPVLIGGAATVGSAAVEERGLEAAVDDTKIRAEINHLWLQHDEAMYREVSLTVTEGRVLLTGQVPTAERRVDAVRLAWQAAGVKEVNNEIQVTDQSGFIDYSRDVIIANTLRKRLLFDNQVKNVNYSVDCVNGIVYLMGIAQNDAELERVIGHARNISNVKKVVSYVVLKDDPKRFSS